MRATSRWPWRHSSEPTRRWSASCAAEPRPRAAARLPVRAPDRGQAGGAGAGRRRHRLRRRRAARGDPGLHPRRARRRRRGRAGLDVPGRRGPARAARGDRGLGVPPLRRAARRRARGGADLRLQGGGLPPRPGRLRRRRPRRRHGPGLSRAGARRALCRLRGHGGRAGPGARMAPRPGRGGLAGRAAALAELPQQPHGRLRPARALRAGDRARAPARLRRGLGRGLQRAVVRRRAAGVGTAGRRSHRRPGVQHALQALLDARLPLGVPGRRRGVGGRGQALSPERRRCTAALRPTGSRRRLGRRGACRGGAGPLCPQAGAAAARARRRRAATGGRRRDVLPVAARGRRRRRRGARAAPALRARARAGARLLLRCGRSRPSAGGAGPDSGALRGGCAPARVGLQSRSMTRTDLAALAARIEQLYELPTIDLDDDAVETVEHALALLDEGAVRVAHQEEGGWRVNEWAKKAILLSFRTRAMQTIEVGPYEYHDKMPLKGGWAQRGVRVVPPATVRQGAYVAPGVVLMPSYVNVGAWVGSGTMVDTWATVGSCAQIGQDVHLSGGVGIGGVLEPPQASPVVIEDEVMVGSRCMVTQGARVGKGSVLAEGLILNPSIPVIDAETGKQLGRGHVPPWSVVIGATRPREYPGGTFGLPCALVVTRLTEGERHDKSKLNDILRGH